jgi:hypothetical protein
MTLPSPPCYFPGRKATSLRFLEGIYDRFHIFFGIQSLYPLPMILSLERLKYLSVVIFSYQSSLDHLVYLLDGLTIFFRRVKRREKAGYPRYKDQIGMILLRILKVGLN